MGGKLIYICGPDGVGKTTQAQLLIQTLKDKGKIFEYRWLRFYHLFSLPLLGIARLMGLSEVQTLDDGEKIGYHYFYKSKTISFIYPLLLYIDTLISSIIKLYIPLKLFNKNIVCDRFIYDTIIDLTISTRKPNIHLSVIGKNFMKLIPQKTKIVMLHAAEEELRNRRVDVNNDKTLEMKLELYRNLGDKFNIPVIKANLPIEDVHKKIITELNLLFINLND